MPSISKFEVLFGCWKRLWLAFAKRAPRLCHDLVDILVLVNRQTLELLHFSVVASLGICYTRQFIGWVGVFDAEAGRKLSRLFTEVFSEIVMVKVVSFRSRDVESIVPLWHEVASSRGGFCFGNTFLASYWSRPRPKLPEVALGSPKSHIFLILIRVSHSTWLHVLLVFIGHAGWLTFVRALDFR